MPARTFRLGRLVLRSALALVALAAALCAGELLLRAADPYGISYYTDTNRYLNECIELLPPERVGPESRIFQNRPRLDVRFETFRFATDDVGLRAPDPERVTELRAASGDAARLRILFLGDSVTLGWGVDDEATWIRTLEREARSADGRALECLNAGHLQYNTAQEADLFAQCAAALRPDVVVLTFVANDVLDDPFGTYTAIMANAAAPPTSAGLTGALGRTYDRARANLRALRGVLAFRRNVAVESAPVPAGVTVRDHPHHAEGLELCRRGLASIHAQCAALGARLVVLDHGKPRIDEVRTWCEEAGVPWFDFTFTDAEWELGLRNSAADAHANARGHALLAEKAQRALTELGILAAAVDDP